MQWHQMVIELGSIFTRGEGALMAGLFGLFMGSFFNVCADRYIAGESIVYPPSHCTACGNRLRAWELIPVVSWVALRGKCAHCQAPISVVYPLVEIVTGGIYALTASQFGWSHALFIWLFFASLFLIAAVIDLKALILPDVITLPAAVIAVPAAIWGLGRPWETVLLGGFVASGLFWLIQWIYKKRTGIDGMGLGDVKIMLSLGFLSGLAMLPLVIIVAGVTALVAFGVIRLVSGKTIANRELPFGPFLVLGAWVSWLYGEAIWQWWLSVVL